MLKEKKRGGVVLQRYRVIFSRFHRNKTPYASDGTRTFYVRASDAKTAFEIAKTIEKVVERPAVDRERSLEDTIIDALIGETDDAE